jgi:hypothetical protein
VPLLLALGACIVIALYIGANIAYVAVLPLEKIQHAPSDRVAGAMLQAIFPSVDAALLAVAVMISAFGCIKVCCCRAPELTSPWCPTAVLSARCGNQPSSRTARRAS